MIHNNELRFIQVEYLAQLFSDLQEIIAVQRQTGRKLTVISQHRFDPATIMVKEAIDCGKLGKIILVATVAVCAAAALGAPIAGKMLRPGGNTVAADVALPVVVMVVEL